jgi:hypothetical protein
MITLNITTESDEHLRSRDPRSVEVYVGAMESYEHFDLGGIHWKLPTGMVEDLLNLFKARTAQPSTPSAE